MTHTSTLRTVALAATLALAGAAAHATTSIDTTPSWSGTGVAPFGVNNTATYGQTITTDAAGGTLNSFTFYLGELPNADFRAAVYAWDGSKASGSALFSTGALNTGSYNGFQAFTVNTGGVALAGNTQYVLFFTTSGLQAGHSGTDSWGYVGSDVYSGGGFVFFNNGDDYNALTTQAWDGPQWWGQTTDLAFKADFTSAVPEPGSVALMLAGLGVVGLRSRRSRKA